MSKIAVIYWSGTGNTEAMANAIYEIVKPVGADMFNVSEITPEKALEYDVLLLGCPAMGAEVLEECEFEPFFTEIESGLKGKKIGLFGSYGWGDGEWMRLWEERTRADGAVILGCVTANDAPDDKAIKECEELAKLAF